MLIITIIIFKKYKFFIMNKYKNIDIFYFEAIFIQECSNIIKIVIFIV